ncbi:uncharacterized protein LOC127450884 isoform X1 [Myxocyprinus asiaticus]|uniref:uncharacterized protein LOC127450884 isoform X1 n=1 Tax=Myxocyprinus asiaticus TaxID=70543 RepID=UPI0022223A2F|nr:uncharacterized protein LOC127450884 isoform X1 [Myxocyprinus asiaticus]
MTKLQLLHRALNERLMAAVEQIMEMVGCTVLEYEEETVRVRKENEVLRRRLRWMEGANPADWQGPSEPVMLTTLDKSNPSQQEESTVSFRFELESEELVIKTETIDHPLNARPDSSHATLPQSTDQGSAIAGTSAGINYSLTDGMTWDSNQSYMAPLDFDPTSNSRVSSWREGSRRQRMSFACPDCGKVFGSKQRLMFHMRIHSTERPYAYRRRKACFYGDKNKRKNKLHGLSQLSRKIGDDLSDGSEQTNGSSALAERLAITGPEQDQDSPTTESDTSSDKDPENSTANPVHLVHQQKAKKRMPCCPHCSRVFIRPGRLAAHIKRHLMEARRHSVNLPNTYSARNEMVDEKRKLPKKQRIVNNDAVVKDRAKRLKKNMPVQNKLSKGKTKEADPKNSGSTKVHSTKRVKVQMKIFPCPHCDKVFAREGWLGPHIQMRHFKENSISYFDSLPGSGLRRSRRPFTKVFYKGTPDAEGISKESKQENKANLIVIVPKVNINEAVQSADGHKIVTESKRAPEEPEESKKDASDFDRETSGTESLMNTFPCELCDKTFMMKWRLKKHKRTHIAQNLLLHKRRKRMLMDEESLMETKLKQQKQESREAKKPSEEEEKLNDKGSTSNTQPKKSQSMEDAEMMVKNKPGCCVCKYCGKIYTRINWLKKHMLGHRKEKLVARNEQSETDKMQSNEGNTNKPSSKTRGQGSFPCPFCDKVFTREMRLLMHMQIHSGEKPYSYRQRKAQFYGDIRCRLPRNHNHEVSTIPPLRGNRDVSEESAGEETINEDKSAHLSISATDPVSQDLCQPQSALQACTGSLNILPQTVTGQPNQRTESELVSDVISHINLQPRIVLEPIMTECKYLSTVSGVGDVKTDSSERSGFDLEQTSCPALIDDEMGDVMNDHIVGYKPGVGYSGISETDIVCVEVGSLQQVSQTEVELNNTVVPQATEFSVGNNTKGQQKVVSENQIPVIVIDDEPEQSATQTSTFASSLESASSEPITAAKNAPTGCGKTNWDREEISAMKLTVMEPTPFLESVFKETTSGAMQKNIDSELFVVLSDSEDDVDDDMLGPSKGLDKKKIASVASISKEQLDASRTVIPESVIKAPNNDSQIPAPDAMESITEDPTTIDSASQQTDSDADTDVEFVPNERNDQSISNDLLIKDQMASAGIKQTEDSSMTQKKEMKISGLIFAGQESLSQHLQGHTDKKLLDMKIVFGDERKNKKHGVNQQGSYRNNPFQQHCLTCEQKNSKGASCSTQEIVDEELRNPTPDTIGSSRLQPIVESANTPLSNPNVSTLQKTSDSRDHPILNHRAHEAQQNDTQESDTLVHTTNCDLEHISPPTVDPWYTAAQKTCYQEPERPPVSDDLNAVSSNPSCLDPCQSAAINLPHLESEFPPLVKTGSSTTKNSDVEMLEEPLHRTPSPETTVSAPSILNICCNILQQSSVEQTDHPQPCAGLGALNKTLFPEQDKSFVSKTGCSDTQQTIVQECDGCLPHDTGCSEDLKLSSKPKELLTSGLDFSDSSSTHNMESNSISNLAVIGSTNSCSDDIQHIHDLNVDRSLFLGSGSCDEIESPDPGSCGYQPTVDPESNSNPPFQDIKPKAVEQMSCLKSHGCNLQEEPHKIIDVDDNSIAVEAEHDSSISVTSKHKRKKNNQNSSLKEDESMKSCPSVLSQSFTDNDALSTSSFEKAPEGPECQTNSSDEKSRLFKTHYCIYCKKPRYRMIAHLQSAHPSEPEVAKALSFDKSSKERRQLLSLLQTKGNVLHNTDVVKNSTRDVKPFARFAVSSSFDDRVNCIYCLGLFSKKSFDTHLEQCQGKCPQNAETSGNEMPHTTEIKAEHESTNCSNEEVSLSQCNVDQERSITPTSEISSITAYPNRDCIPRSPGNDFSPPQNAQTVSDDLSKSSVKAQTHETWRRGRKRKRRSCHQNQTLFMEDDLLGEGESSTPNSKVYACQHCGATFCSPYKLRRHEYTHTGCTPSCTDQVKLKRSKRGVHSEETSVKDEARKELTQPHKESPEDLLNTVNESTGEEAASTYQDTEESEFHWEEAGHSRQDTC